MENDDKLRIRSAEERIMHSKGMSEVKDIFNSLGLSFNIGGGTLLGAYRNNDFIPWDWDIEFDLRYEDVRGKEKIICNAFEEKGFVCTKKIFNKKEWKITYSKYGTEYEFLSWYKGFNTRRRRNSRLKSKFFNGNENIVFYGETYPCLSPIEEFLVYHYGDWKTPKKTLDKKVYNAGKYYIKQSRIKKIFKKFLKKLKK